jgi:hypothetical protein
MDNLNPLPNLPEEPPQTSGSQLSQDAELPLTSGESKAPVEMQHPMLEVIQPSPSPVTVKLRTARVLWATLVPELMGITGTLWGKVAIAAVAAAIAGGTAYHFTHLKPVSTPADHLLAPRIPPKHSPIVHKTASSKTPTHKASKSSKKRTRHKTAKSHKTTSDKNTPLKKGQHRPWFSKDTSNS